MNSTDNVVTVNNDNKCFCKYWDEEYGNSHWFIVDHIDINPERSMEIVYCKKCEIVK